MSIARVVSGAAMVAALVVVTIAAPAAAAGGELVSVATFGGTGSDQGWGVAADAAGNVYTAGTFSGTVDLDPGPGVAHRTSAGALDVFVTKVDATGIHLWTATFGGTGNDWGRGVAVDAAGNVFTTGSFQGVVDFDPGPGVVSRTSNGFDDVFVTKLSPTGTHVWTSTLGGTGFDQGFGIAVDAAGNAHATGAFQGTVDFDPGPGVFIRSSAGGEDVFVTRLAASGAHQWTATFGGTDFDSGLGVAADAAGNVHTTGYFAGTVDFDPGPGVVNRTSALGADVFVTKLDANGALLWAATFGGADLDSGRGVAIDTAGNVHTTGTFRETVDFDPGPGVVYRTSNGVTDGYVTKLSPTGTHLWTATFGGTGFDQGWGVAVDAAGNVHTTGFFGGTVDFDPGPGVADRSSAGGDDVFVTKLGATGAHQWTATFGGTGNDSGLGVVVDAAGRVHTTGSFRETVDFDPGPGTANRTSAGVNDAFVVDLAAKGLCDGRPVTVDLAAGDTPTNGDDVISGTAGNDTIAGGGGNDTICGLGGDDTIFGGAGDDQILGGDGLDTIFGGDGADTIFGDAGNDTIQGNAGTDTLWGGDGNDTLSGNDDDDFIDGLAGDDTIFGGAGNDILFGWIGADTILGGLGDDQIEGDGDDDLLSGNAGNDTINGGTGNDTVYGVDGNDSLAGGTGFDVMLGGNGADTIDGGNDDDALSGNAGNDDIAGGAGNDEIYGVDGNDTLAGGPGVDTILGGNGNDIIDGGDGNDLLSGNAGIDTVDGGPGADEVYGADGNDTLTGGPGPDIILGGNNNDAIDSADGQADQVSGNNGTDTCTRDPGIDTVFACEALIP